MSGCHFTNEQWDFVFVGSWPATAKTAARTGILSWNGSLDYDGISLTTWTESTTSGSSSVSVDVSYEDLAPGLRGSANCGDGTVRINSDQTDPAIIEDVARHETGHILAMDHTGFSDSHNGDRPTLATCLTDTDAINRIKAQDDVGSLNFSHSILSFPANEHPFMANFGFEQGFSYWGLFGGSVSYQTTAGATGPGHIAFTPANAAADYVYQTMTYSDAPGRQIMAVMNHEVWSLFDQSTVRVELWSRDIDYGTTQDCDLSVWPNQKNMNQRTEPGSWVRRATATANAAGTWLRTDSPTWATESDGDQDVQVRVFADPRTLDGQRTAIRLDNVRIQCFLSQIEGDCQ